MSAAVVLALVMMILFFLGIGLLLAWVSFTGDPREDPAEVLACRTWGVVSLAAAAVLGLVGNLTGVL